MKGVMIKVKEGHSFEGEGESLGKDFEGNNYSFWKSSGTMEVPVELAMKLENERPQRYTIVDDNIAKALGFSRTDIHNITAPPTPKEPVLPPKMPVPAPVENSPFYSVEISLKELDKMTKDQINDWAAKRDFNVDPAKKKPVLIQELIKQIEAKTGVKVV